MLLSGSDYGFLSVDADVWEALNKCLLSEVIIWLYMVNEVI